MAPRAKRRRTNGVRRRKPLGAVTANQRWLHLSAAGEPRRRTQLGGSLRKLARRRQSPRHSEGKLA
eukprot:CAMPEP_0201880734 /NCGR_PEP_ID=MMETSP0902-20130614/11247_1 /ASSEMBLY_ACC=CAM_ASM_000551 /TAXON_ID=420261 /ORGANISM="Thalassiosira antarctica, Strain CCMP982" /LENGTH=65 /DNA_ID=CAMNT_0048408795 /DNA_START=161 /DNA_END=358 /DNA_ORIENTATION=+